MFHLYQLGSIIYITLGCPQLPYSTIHLLDLMECSENG